MTASDLLDFRAQAQDAMESLWPASIILDGVDGALACAGGNLKQVEESLGIGGLFPGYDLAFRIRKTVLPDMPAVGTRLTWNDKTYRIMRVTNPATDVAWVIGCDNPAK